LQDAERRALYDMHGMEAVDDGQPRRAAVHGGCSPGDIRLQPGYTGLQPCPRTVAGSAARTFAWSCR
jgi:hypothetical protein